MGMWTMISRDGLRRTFCIPSSSPRRAAASSKRTSADIFGLNSDSRVDGMVASRIICGVVSTLDYRTSSHRYFAGHDSFSRRDAEGAENARYLTRSLGCQGIEFLL